MSAWGSRTASARACAVEQLLAGDLLLLGDVALAADLERELLEVERLLGPGFDGDALVGAEEVEPGRVDVDHRCGAGVGVGAEEPGLSIVARGSAESDGSGARNSSRSVSYQRPPNRTISKCSS